MGLAETLQIDEMVQDFKRMNKRQVSYICWEKLNQTAFYEKLAHTHTQPTRKKTTCQVYGF